MGMGWNVMVKSLVRNWYMPALVVLQVMFAMVVLVNAGSMLYQKISPVLARPGVPSGQVLMTRMLASAEAGLPHWNYSNLRTAEQAVRSIPGVKAVSVGFGAPLTADGLLLKVQPTTVKGHRSVHADLFSGDHVVSVLGLHVVEGRNFGIDDLQQGGFSNAMGKARTALITRALAQQLFPNEDAVGKSLWLFSDPKHNNAPLRIIGVVSNTFRSQLNAGTPGQIYNVVFTPLEVDASPFASFMIRSESSRRDAVMRLLPATISSSLGIRADDHIRVSTYESLRDKILHGDRASAWMLFVLLITVAIVVMLGISSLTRFWMQNRMHEIGIRRALGAKRIEIAFDYLSENLMIVALGIFLGLFTGIASAAWLQKYFPLHTPSTVEWVLSATILIACSQLSVINTVLRAAYTPPLDAMRSA
jgi:putative ABC transport system permease protein